MIGIEASEMHPYEDPVVKWEWTEKEVMQDRYVQGF